MRDYDFRLGGTLPYILEAQGSRFLYKTGEETNGKPGIIVSAERGGLELLLMPGEGVRLPSSPGRWAIRKADPTAFDVSGRVIVGDADFTASRVQGDVNLLNASALSMPDGWRRIREQLLSNPQPQVRRFRAGAFVDHVQMGDITSLGAIRFLAASVARTTIVRRILLTRNDTNADPGGLRTQFALAVHLVSGSLTGAQTSAPFYPGLAEGNSTPTFSAESRLSTKSNALSSEAPTGGMNEFLQSTMVSCVGNVVEAVQEPIVLPPSYQGTTWGITIGIPNMQVNESANAYFEWEEWQTWPTS